MCRWIAYSGEPIPMELVVTRPVHSLIDQSLHTRLNYQESGAVLPTNGDGFGLGWYGQLPEPCVVKDEHPAWNNQNLQNLCRHINSGLFFAHIRATTTGAVQRTNCHPFSYKNWLFQHNGGIADFTKMRRDLQLDIAPELYPELKGTTDSETFFLLCLTYGLDKDVKTAVERAIARIRKAAQDNQTSGEFNLSCAFSDGTSLYTIRYAENTEIKSQFYSTHPKLLSDFSRHHERHLDGSAIFLSEPVDGLDEKWTESPKQSLLITRGGQVEAFLLKA